MKLNQTLADRVGFSSLNILKIRLSPALLIANVVEPLILLDGHARETLRLLDYTPGVIFPTESMPEHSALEKLR